MKIALLPLPLFLLAASCGATPSGVDLAERAARENRRTEESLKVVVAPCWTDDEAYFARYDGATRSLAVTDTAAVTTKHRPLPGSGETPPDFMRAEGETILIAMSGVWWKLPVRDDRFVRATPEETASVERSLRPGRDGAEPGRGEPETIGFRNALATPVRVFWRDEATGLDASYATLASGEFKTLRTFGGHRWLTKDETGAVLDDVRTPRGGAIVTVGSGRAGDEPAIPDKRRDARSGKRTKKAAAPDTAGETTESEMLSPDGGARIRILLKTAPVRKIRYENVHVGGGTGTGPLVFDYDKPGDPIDERRPALFDAVSGAAIPVAPGAFADVRIFSPLGWAPDSSEFRIHLFYRDNRRMAVVGVRRDGSVRTILSETAPTFLDYSQKGFFRVLSGDRLLAMSERDGRNRLYVFDLKTGAELARFPGGTMIVRAVERVDEAAGTAEFTAYAARPGEDPYYANLVRCRLDGSGEPVVLTHGDGDHTAVFSPKRRFLIDTWSRVDLPPAATLRRASDGGEVATLVAPDPSRIPAGYPVPERFTAKGRDGITDIFGVIFRPSHPVSGDKLPVVEYVYAGPHGFNVPKRWGAWAAEVKTLAEYGFAVVVIDGMGTNWRDRAFHDVCWKNIGDAGFDDRVAWMRAAAKAHPELDLARVGIWGGSAGGQNAAGALIRRPDFYKAAVADCGCHDNRIDKLWWNEAWMGWPVDDAAMDASSNIVNAGKLRGDLLLLLGECDTNVDTACTYRFADALKAAGKPFELHVVPGAGHFVSFRPEAFSRIVAFFRRTLRGEGG